MTGPSEEWPPRPDTPRGEVARAVMLRLSPELGPLSVRTTDANVTDDGWQARVGVWPYSPEVVDKVQRILAPVTASVFPQPETPRRTTR
jgi:hypothetical protein